MYPPRNSYVFSYSYDFNLFSKRNFKKIMKKLIILAAIVAVSISCAVDHGLINKKNIYKPEKAETYWVNNKGLHKK